ncbi:MAG: 2-dehydropantoate 2-reductase [Firmicutes bacterium]|nr:2-dehydropantoate 2-reductase [Bacillota bacterium]
MKICVVGIGGVGGFLGGELVRKMARTEDLVYFMTRGIRKEQYQKTGLQICSDLQGKYRVRPYGIGETAEELGPMDVVFLCVKSYDLEETCSQIRDMVGPDTIVVPVMDGIETAKNAARYLGRGIVLDAAIYVDAESQPDFSVCQKGMFCDLFLGARFPDKLARKMGYSQKQRWAMETIASIFRYTDIQCTVTEDIEMILWKRFLLGCAYNTVTAAHGIAVGTIRRELHYQVDLKGILNECAYIARLKKIQISGHIEEDLMSHILWEYSPESRSPMLLDVDSGRPAELDIFSGYLIELGKELLVDVPATKRLHDMILEKMED